MSVRDFKTTRIRRSRSLFPSGIPSSVATDISCAHSRLGS
jgi:hypothetical protein